MHTVLLTMCAYGIMVSNTPELDHVLTAHKNVVDYSPEMSLNGNDTIFVYCKSSWRGTGLEYVSDYDEVFLYWYSDRECSIFMREAITDSNRHDLQNGLQYNIHEIIYSRAPIMTVIESAALNAIHSANDAHPICDSDEPEVWICHTTLDN